MTAQKQPEISLEQPKAPSWFRTPEGIVELYANAIHFMWSLDDIRLRLGQMVEHPDTPNPGPSFVPATKEIGAVTLSWRNAKLLRDQLTRVVESYEKVNGEIKIDVKLPSPL